MITYNDIYDAARKERYSEQLQKLPDNFLEDVASYVKEKKELALRKGDIFSENILKTKKQLENALTLFKELILRRRKKILNLVLISPETGVPKEESSNLLGFEEKLFEDLINCLEVSDKRFSDLFDEHTKNAEKNEKICFLEEIEEFVDLEGNNIGPFGKTEIACLPKEISKIFLESGKAEVFVEE